ncbi:hypothetical protein LX36DRAFT_650812 [Colletotrichum falcatum]|nr:hypothetical protein LX36DRAFT_650812 [Colletotrichum falcatum]
MVSSSNPEKAQQGAHGDRSVGSTRHTHTHTHLGAGMIAHPPPSPDAKGGVYDAPAWYADENPSQPPFLCLNMHMQVQFETTNRPRLYLV